MGRRLRAPLWALVAATLTTTATTGHAATAELSKVGLAINGEAAGDQAGLQVATGDFDGDRVEDLVVGAFGNDHGGKEYTGAVYIEYGPIRRGFSLARADVKLYSTLAGDYAGEGPLGVADLDGDRKDDLVLGTPGSFLATQPSSPGKVGEAFLLYGGKRLKGVRSLPEVADARFTGVQLGEWLGFGTAGVGDLDGDGFEEVVLGAPATAGYTGAAYLFYGGRERFRGDVPVADADATFVGSRPGEMFGYTAVGGDLDGDRASDLLLTGAPFPAPQPAGIALYYGGKGARLSGRKHSAAADARLEMPTAPSEFVAPTWLSAAEDLTGDGVADLAVGTGATTNADSAGRTWVVAGGARRTGVDTVDRAARTTIVGVGSSGAAGRLDRDRRADVAIGDATGGRVLVFTGPLPAGELSADAAARTLVADGEDAGVAMAVGDLTGDRRADIVTGAPSADETGVVYVVPQGR